jgi:uncharacterized repeat protein (TIGR03847 family)
LSASFEVSDASRITIGTVGEPGQRTFYLQARDDVRLVTLKLEKQQAAALGQLLGDLLSDLPAPGQLPPDLGLEEPVDDDWPIGTMQLAYDSDADRVVLIAEEATAEEEEGGAIGRFVITREQAAALVARTESLVTAGRPPCPLCGHPLNPAGHTCPKTNGHRPPER